MATEEQGPERSNILIDGAGYTLQGTGASDSEGIELTGRNNVTIKNMKITAFYHGVSLYSSSNSSVSGNNITANSSGICLAYSSNNNSISGNNITNNGHGIEFYSSSNNRIFHNNFINNYLHIGVNERSLPNVLDDGYPVGGNYWSSYTGVDLYSGSNQNATGSDGIGDAPHVIDEDNTDRYPLMAPYSTFDAGTWNQTPYNIDVVSNSTVSDLHFNPQEGPYLEFNVTGQEGTVGFCRVAIPKNLLWAEDEQWIVLVEGVPITNYTITSDENHSISTSHITTAQKQSMSKEHR
jgi:parallel beta-helix repeat protein